MVLDIGFNFLPLHKYEYNLVIIEYSMSFHYIFFNLPFSKQFQYIQIQLISKYKIALILKNCNLLM